MQGTINSGSLQGSLSGGGSIQGSLAGSGELSGVFNSGDELTGSISGSQTIQGVVSETSALTGTLSKQADANPYSGEYEFTPTTDTQTVYTANKTLSQNITINPIPSNYGLITYNGSIITVS